MLRATTDDVKTLQSWIGVPQTGVADAVTVDRVNYLLGTHFTADYVTAHALDLAKQAASLHLSQQQQTKSSTPWGWIVVGSGLAIGLAIWAGSRR